MLKRDQETLARTRTGGARRLLVGIEREAAAAETGGDFSKHRTDLPGDPATHCWVHTGSLQEIPGHQVCSSAVHNSRNWESTKVPAIRQRCPPSDRHPETAVGAHRGILCGYKKERHSTICGKMDAAGGHHVEGNKPDTERPTPHVLPYM